jgi:MoxR-like ATPase
VLTGADVLEMQQAVKADSRGRIAGQLRSQHRAKNARVGTVSRWASRPAARNALYRAAQAMAFLEGRTFCTPEDIKPLVVPVFAHRVVVNGLYAST